MKQKLIMALCLAAACLGGTSAFAVKGTCKEVAQDEGGGCQTENADCTYTKDGKTVSGHCKTTSKSYGSACNCE